MCSARGNCKEPYPQIQIPWFFRQPCHKDFEVHEAYGSFSGCLGPSNHQ